MRFWTRSWQPLAIFLACLPVADYAAAQSRREDTGLVLRWLDLSVGAGSVQLPPITLSGYLPQDVLSADLIATTSGALTWRRSRRSSTYGLNASGQYTGRAKYSAMSAFGGGASFDAAHKLGRRWSTLASVSSGIFNSDQLSFASAQAERVTANAETVEDLAAALALARSVRPASNPDIAEAALFVPINQSVVSSEVYGNRLMNTGVSAGVSYSRSARSLFFVQASSSWVRRAGSSQEPGRVQMFPDSRAQLFAAGWTYAPSRRAELGLTAKGAASSGAFTNRSTVASGWCTWHVRRWLMGGSLGFALQSTPPPLVTGIEEPKGAWTNSPALTYGLVFGFKSRTQTMMIEHNRSTHDPYGYGGRNPRTGFAAPLVSTVASWNWGREQGKWHARSMLAVYRVPGNFLNIYTWHETTGVYRNLTRDLRLGAEFLFDRHGSKGFEGFHLTREVLSIQLAWTPGRRLF